MLKFHEQGRGAPVLLIHAFPLDHTMWDPQVKFFADRFRVITPDIPGFGDSDNIGPWSIPQLAAEMVALIDHLALERCVIAGLSLGGYIALSIAVKHPGVVARLILAHTRSRADTETERASRTDLIAALEKDGTSILPSRLLPRLLGPNAAESVRQQVAAMVERANREACIHAITAMRERPDMTVKLPEIACPTMVVAGDSDVIIPVEECQKMASMIPQGTIAVIPKTGHLSNLEDSRAFNASMDTFLSL
jgi:pimeloyl-ACP methyl ester carboxylesterase